MSDVDKSQPSGPMVVCEACRRHIAAHETQCPFCHAPAAPPAFAPKPPDYLPPPAYGMPPVPGERASGIAKGIVLALVIIAASILLTLRFAF